MTEEFKPGDLVDKIGGRYGGPGRIVGDTMALDDSGYKLFNVAHRIEGGYGEFVHVFPASALKYRGEPASWPPLEDGVADVVQPLRAFVSDRPRLLSLLYDIDMLPEQCVTMIGALRLTGLCEVWKLGEAGELLTVSTAPAEPNVDMIPMAWTDPASPSADYCRYDHVYADTPIGRYQIEWKSWKKYDSFDVECGQFDWHGSDTTLDGAKAIAAAHFKATVSACFAMTKPEITT